MSGKINVAFMGCPLLLFFPFTFVLWSHKQSVITFILLSNFLFFFFVVLIFRVFSPIVYMNKRLN